MAKTFPKNLALLSLGLASGIFLLGLLLGDEKLLAVSLPATAVPLMLSWLFSAYHKEARKKKIEEAVPDVLLLASSMPGANTTERLAEFVACNSEGPLAEEFSDALSEMRAGMPGEEALGRISGRNDSASLSRAIGLIVSAMESGADMASAFRETAEDFIQTNSIMRERNAATAMQKYTLLLSAGIAVPFILGKLGSMVQGFSSNGLAEMISGQQNSNAAALLESAGLANAVYIAEFAIIASAFIAFQESRPKKAVVYACLIIPLGQAVYFLSWL